MSSSSFLKIFLTVTLGFGVLHGGSLAVYLYAPEMFYHKPWEYFTDVAFRVKGVPLHWKGMEYHDLTRENFFLYQEAFKTTYTMDADGFRIRPFEADNYPIVFSGDSTIFGSRVNDEETLPWQLAEKLQMPVFNGSRTTTSNLLAHPSLQNTEIFFDGTTERAIYPRILKKWLEVKKVTFEPLAKKELTIFQAVGDVPPQRYSAPMVLMKIAERLAGDLADWTSGEQDAWRFMHHKMLPEELDETVALIATRKRAFDAMGIRYIFLPVPAKQTIYADNVDEYTRNFIPTLIARLRAEGVEAVDLVTPFRAHKDEILFFHYDTHWNSKGTTLAAKVISEQVFGR